MRPLLLGQAPSSTSDPAAAFSGRSGRRLADLVGVPFPELAATFDLANLLNRYPGQDDGRWGDRFPARRVRAAARELVGALDARRVIFVGAAVSIAFAELVNCRSLHVARIGPLPPLVWRRFHVCGTQRRCAPAVEFLGALLPHPSGLNRWWNDRTNVRDARRFLWHSLRPASVTSAARVTSRRGGP